MELNFAKSADKGTKILNHEDSHNVDIFEPKTCDDDKENISFDKTIRESKNINEVNIESEKLDDIIKDIEGLALINLVVPMLVGTCQEVHNHDAIIVLTTNDKKTNNMVEGGGP